MRSPSWSSPRALTSKASPEAEAGPTDRDTLVSASAASRSPILLEVSWLPSLPAKGEALGEKIMLQVQKHTHVISAADRLQAGSSQWLTEATHLTAAAVVSTGMATVMRFPRLHHVNSPNMSKRMQMVSCPVHALLRTHTG